MVSQSHTFTLNPPVSPLNPLLIMQSASFFVPGAGLGYLNARLGQLASLDVHPTPWVLRGAIYWTAQSFFTNYYGNSIREAPVFYGKRARWIKACVVMLLISIPEMLLYQNRNETIDVMYLWAYMIDVYVHSLLWNIISPLWGALTFAIIPNHLKEKLAKDQSFMFADSSLLPKGLVAWIAGANLLPPGSTSINVTQQMKTKITFDPRSHKQIVKYVPI